MFKEFKEFIMQGNVLDLAIGVVMGAAFTAIVNSLVEDMIGPIIAAVSGNSDISGLTISIGSAELGVGAFLQSIINFLLISIVLFIIIKGVNTITRQFKHEEEKEEEPAPTAEDLLADIKTILKEEKQAQTNPPEEESPDQAQLGQLEE